MVPRSEEHTSELQSLRHLVCRLLLEKKKKKKKQYSVLPHIVMRTLTLRDDRGRPQPGPHRRPCTRAAYVTSFFFFFFFFFLNNRPPPNFPPFPHPPPFRT